MSYNHPIITEIYADIYLEPGSLPFIRVFDLVPQLIRAGFSTVEGDLLEMEPSGVRERVIRCWSSDRGRLIQIAPDNIVMNLVSPDGTYPGWKMFLDAVAKPTLRVLSGALGAWRPQAVSLNTLDRAVLPLPSFRLGDYLNCGGPRIPAILADTSIAFDYDVGRGALAADSKNRQIHINGQPTREAYAIHIHSVFQERIQREDEVLATLDRLHDESNSSFESLITDQMRTQIMKGTANASIRG